MAEDLALRAMNFARQAHAGHVRKYTGAPYADHLAEVAGIVATVAPFGSMRLMVSVAWLHDCVEDVGVTLDQIKAEFGPEVAQGVAGLSDLEVGNRAERKAASRARLAACDGWIQTIKCADLISNTPSIVKHDADFAVTYLAEKQALLDVLARADPRLVEIARAQAKPEPVANNYCPWCSEAIRPGQPTAMSDGERMHIGCAAEEMDNATFDRDFGDC